LFPLFLHNYFVGVIHLQLIAMYQKAQTAANHAHAPVVLGATACCFGTLAFCFLLGGGIGYYNVSTNELLYSGVMQTPFDYKGEFYPSRMVLNGIGYPFWAYDDLAFNESFAKCIGYDESLLIEADETTKCKSSKLYTPKCDETHPKASLIYSSASGAYANAQSWKWSWKNKTLVQDERNKKGAPFSASKATIAWTGLYALFAGIVALAATRSWTNLKMIVLLALLPPLLLSAVDINNVIQSNWDQFHSWAVNCQGMDESVYYNTRSAPDCITTNKKTYASFQIQFLTGKEFEKFDTDCGLLKTQTMCFGASNACSWNPIEIPAVPENKDLNSRAQAKVPANTCVSKDYKLGRDVYKCSDEELKYWYGDGKRCGTFSDQVEGVNVIRTAVKRDCGGYVDYEKANCWKKKTAPKCTWKVEDVITGCTDSTKNLPPCDEQSYRIGLKYTLDKNSGIKTVSDTMADYEECDDDFHKRLVASRLYSNYTNVAKYCMSDPEGNYPDYVAVRMDTRLRVATGGIGFLYIEMFFLALILLHASYCIKQEDAPDTKL
jgi:hypothetical protein